MTKYIILSLLVSTISACQKDFDKGGLDSFSSDQLNLWNKVVTDIMVTDIFSPRVASRIYAYSNMAAYEAIAPANAQLKSPSGTIKLPQPEEDKDYYFPVASIIAICTVA